MRILHLGMLYPPHVIGGAELSVAALAEAQQLAGHVVAAACTTPGSFRIEERHGVEVFRMPHETSFWAEDWPRHGKLRRAYRKFAQQYNYRLERHFADVIARFRPDVIHSHSMVDVTTRCWLAGAQAGVPIVHTLRDYDLLCADSTMYHGGLGCGIKCRAMTFAKRPHHRMIGAVAALSAETLAIHRAHGLFAHLDGDRMVVIPNGISPGPVESHPNRQGPIRFGFLGRVSPEKGLDLLITALRDLPGDAEWELLVGGAVPAYVATRLQATIAGLPIRLLGHVDSTAFLREIDVLVVPSLWVEPFGRVIGEAYAAGIPVLGANTGGIADLIGRVDPEWLFPVGEIDSLRMKLAAIADRGRPMLPHPDRFRSLVDALTWPIIARQYDALYAKAISLGGIGAD